MYVVLSTGTRNPTLAAKNITKIKKWDEDMAMKYTIASLLSVRKAFGPLVPRYIGSKIRARMTTKTKTAMSGGADRVFGSRNGWIRKSDKKLTKDERESYLSNCPTSFSVVDTQAIQFQRTRRSRS